MNRSRLVSGLVVVIIVATTFPFFGQPTRQFGTCLTCNFRWLADGLANVALFIPLGCALNWKRDQFVRSSLLAATLSIGLELLQTMIPGRDPALGDIIANSVGGMLGAGIGWRPAAWLAPGPRRADALLAMAAISAVAVAWTTGWFLSPSSIPSRSRQVGGNLGAVFRGSGVVRLTAVFDGTEEQSLLRLGPPSPFQFLSLGRTAGDAWLGYYSRGRDVRLDEPEYEVAGFFEGIRTGDSVIVDISRDAPGWCLARPGRLACDVGPTIGRGWGLLIFPYSVGKRWRRVPDLLWTLALFLPMGFWSRRRTIAIALFVAAVTLGPYTQLASLVATPALQWFGGFAGVAGGFAWSYSFRRWGYRFLPAGRAR